MRKSRNPSISSIRRGRWVRAASKQGITLQHAVTVTQLATVMSFVRAGLGVAILPAERIAGCNTDGLKTLPIIGPTMSHNLGLPSTSPLLPLPRTQRHGWGYAWWRKL